MQILEVLIEYNVGSLNHIFSYAYLGDKTIKKGIRVLINFNHKEIVGYVTNVIYVDKTLEEYQKDSIYVIKEVSKIIDDEPLLNDELQELALKLSSYYFASLISVYQSMLPPSLKPKKSSLSKPKIQYETWVRLLSDSEDELTAKQVECLRLIKANKEVLKSELKPHIVKALYEKGKIDFFSKEKTRVFPYFMRVCEFICHNTAYISCPIHMGIDRFC